jgi:hypothetical protein
VTWDKIIAKSYFIRLLLNIVATGILCYLGHLYAENLLYNLDIGTLYAGIATFTTGAMITIFLAAFFSENVRMNLLRNSRHSHTIFYMILTDLLAIIGSGIFINTTVAHAHFLRMMALIIMIIFTLNLTAMVLRLVNLLLKK